MRINKIAIYFTGTTTLIGVVGAIILHKLGYEFVSNLFSGIFASGVLTFIMSIIGYWVERRKTMEKFYTYAIKAVSNLNLFEYEKDLNRSIDSVLQMNQFDYVELDNAYGDMVFLFRNKKKQKYIYEKIYKPILDAKNTVAEACFHFKEYKKAINGNAQAMRVFLSEIAKVFMSVTQRKCINENGLSTVMTYTYNKFVHDLRKELNGDFYRIMYPYYNKKQQEENTNAD